MDNFFDLITDYTFLIVAVGSELLGILSGIIGVYVVVKKQGLICDAISHSTLPVLYYFYDFRIEKSSVDFITWSIYFWNFICIFNICDRFEI